MWHNMSTRLPTTELHIFITKLSSLLLCNICIDICSPRPPLTKLEAFVPQILLTMGMTGGQIRQLILKFPIFRPN